MINAAVWIVSAKPIVSALPQAAFRNRLCVRGAILARARILTAHCVADFGGLADRVEQCLIRLLQKKIIISRTAGDLR